MSLQPSPPRADGLRLRLESMLAAAGADAAAPEAPWQPSSLGAHAGAAAGWMRRERSAPQLLPQPPPPAGRRVVRFAEQVTELGREAAPAAREASPPLPSPGAGPDAPPAAPPPADQQAGRRGPGLLGRMLKASAEEGPAGPAAPAGARPPGRSASPPLSLQPQAQAGPRPPRSSSCTDLYSAAKVRCARVLAARVMPHTRGASTMACSCSVGLVGLAGHAAWLGGACRLFGNTIRGTGARGKHGGLLEHMHVHAAG
jgi:hypothetical protein